MNVTSPGRRFCIASYCEFKLVPLLAETRDALMAETTLSP